MTVPIRHLLAARRHAVHTGEVHRMWPGAAWDVAMLVWWRGVVGPLRRRLRGPGPDERYHSPTGDCPMCNPTAVNGQPVEGEAA